AEQLGGVRADAVVEVEDQLAPVELVVGVEVLGERGDGALDVVGGVGQRRAGQRGEGLLEAFLVQHPVGDVDLGRGHAVVRRAPVVAGELHARWRVRVAGHLVALARRGRGDLTTTARAAGCGGAAGGVGTGARRTLLGAGRAGRAVAGGAAGRRDRRAV